MVRMGNELKQCAAGPSPAAHVFRLVLLGAWVLFTMLLSQSCVQASPANLPGCQTQGEILRSELKKPPGSQYVVEVGAGAYGGNNINSLWEVMGDDQTASRFDAASAYARTDVGEWMRVRRRGWWLLYGMGRRQDYEGNADAAQLWLDLHSVGQTQSYYSPEVQGSRLTARWLALGRDFGLRLGRIHGLGGISARRIMAEDYLAQGLAGEVAGDMRTTDASFSGMLRTLSSKPPSGRPVSGQGWALDMQCQLDLASRWKVFITGEGLLGKISWKDLYVEDVYITSPGVFVDRDGFLRDTGGITGAGWRQNTSVRINPYYRTDFIYEGNPLILGGITFRSGMTSLPNAGLAWRQRRQWLPYTRYYPTERRLEAGAVGAGWQFSISADDWLTLSPRHAEISLSTTPIVF